MLINLYEYQLHIYQNWSGGMKFAIETTNLVVLSVKQTNLIAMSLLR